jgi:ABC-type Mn2+/Zn2+ transport system ATPase subunit
MVSHDLEQVRRVADWVTVLDRRVVLEGSAEVLATSSVRELLPAVGERRAARA